MPGRLGKVTSRTPSMYVDEAIVLGEATEQGEATLGGSRGGKGLSQGEQPADIEKFAQAFRDSGYAGMTSVGTFRT